MKRQIRTHACCVFRDNGSILVTEKFDPRKNECTYAPMGGAVLFGEYSHETIEREVRKCIGAEITNIQYTGTLENIFTEGGEHVHEITLIYEGCFLDAELHRKGHIDGTNNNHPCKVVWMPLDTFQPGVMELHPKGLYTLLHKLTKEAVY
ncbi:MAG: NUDIX domain-containing protein [Chloroflexi bacterium]|nr:NUDIX domain-containing protein [Chloroflexota bacterium]